jgi:hypothetical protein
MSPTRSLVSLGCFLVAVLAVPASSASTPTKLKITGFSIRIEKQIDGYVAETISIAAPNGAQPIKSLRIGQVSGTQYEKTRTGPQLTSGGKSVPHKAVLLNPGSEDGTILLSFARPVTNVRVIITTPVVNSCGVAGVISPVGTATV